MYLVFLLFLFLYLNSERLGFTSWLYKSLAKQKRKLYYFIDDGIEVIFTKNIAKPWRLGIGSCVGGEKLQSSQDAINHDVQHRVKR